MIARTHARVHAAVIAGFVAAIALWAPRPAGAQCVDRIDYDRFVHVEGSVATGMTVQDVEVEGTIAYVAGTLRLELYDISDPTDPSLLGSTPTNGAPIGLAVSGDHVYVADQFAGLTIVDVTDPAQPAVVGHLPLSDETQDVEVRGSIAFVTNYREGLRIVDVTDPTDPQVVHTVDTPSFAISVDLEGNYAFIGDGFSGVQVIDISTPASASIVGAANTVGAVEEADAVGDYVYCADHESGFTIIDASDPTDPFVEINVPLVSISLSVSVVGDVAYVTDQQGGKGIVAFDVSDPTSPVEILSIPIQVDDVTARGSFLYTTTAALGSFRIFDVSPLELAERFHRFDTGAPARRMRVVGSLAYVTSGDRLRILDAPDPLPAQPRGSVTVAGPANDVYVAGSTAYVAYANGLQVVDVGNPDAPVSRGSVGLPDEALGVAAAGGFAYVATSGAGLRIVDVSNPLLPLPQGAEPTTGEARDVVLVDGHAVVADFGGGLRIVNVADPLNPFTVTVLDPPTIPSAFARVGDALYVAGNGLEVVDVSSVLAPAYLGRIDAGAPSDVAVDTAARFAYTTSVTQLDVFDVTDPGDMRHIGTAFSDGTVGGVGVRELVFVTGQTFFDTYSNQCDAVIGVGPVAEPAGVSFRSSRPNPFRSRTRVEFELDVAGLVTLRIHDAGGRLVRTLALGAFPAGLNGVNWDGRDDAGRPVASGVYLARIHVGGAGAGSSAGTRAVRVR